MPHATRILAGAMSGTSADGIDVALVQITGRGLEMSPVLLRHHYRAYPPALRVAICRLRGGDPAPLAVLADVGREISLGYAAAVNEALLAGNLHADDVAAIAAHGQTLYHQPPNTLQWLDPALLAAETGIAVVSDFRRADCAAGGQGAPLVPLADYLLFRHARKNRVLLNIGGIANLTFLPAGREIDQLVAFDTGPGNCLSDHLMRVHEPNGSGWDEGGRLAAKGKPIGAIVQQVMAADYFAKQPPKSTDGPGMIQLFTDALAQTAWEYSIEDLLASACQITAQSIAGAMRQFLHPFPDELIISGGGSQNATLMRMLKQSLGEMSILRSDDLGVASAAKEAVAFALLGAATLDGLPGNVPAATGACRRVVLGSITPKP